MPYKYQVVLDASEVPAQAQQVVDQLDSVFADVQINDVFADAARSLNDLNYYINAITDRAPGMAAALNEIDLSQATTGVVTLDDLLDRLAGTTQGVRDEIAGLSVDISTEFDRIDEYLTNKNPFGKLSVWARAVRHDLTGGSVIVDLVDDVIALYDKMDEAGKRAFGGLIDSAHVARKVAETDIGVIEKLVSGLGPKTVERMRTTGIGATLGDAASLGGKGLSAVRGISETRGGVISKTARSAIEVIAERDALIDTTLGDTYDTLVSNLKDVRSEAERIYAQQRELEAQRVRGREMSKVAREMHYRAWQRQLSTEREEPVDSSMLPVAPFMLPEQPTGVEGIADVLRQAETRLWGVRRIGYAIQQTGRSATIAGTGIVGALSYSGKEFLEYDKYLQRAAATMETTTDMTDRLSSAIIDLSVTARAFSADEIAQGMDIWAQGTGAVVANQQDLNTVMNQTESVMKLAAMNNADLARTADNVGGVITGFGLSLQETEHVAQVFNYTARRTRATVDDVGNTFRYVGPVTNSLGVSFDELAVAIGMAADANIRSTVSGRAFRQMFIRLLKPTDDMNETLNRLLGLSGNLATTWQSVIFPDDKFIGLGKFIDLLAGATENMTEKERSAALATIATANELPTLIALVDQQTEARKRGIDAVSASLKIQRGIVDAETIAYNKLRTETTGQTQTLTDAASTWENVWDRYLTSNEGRIDRLKRTWEASVLRMGDATLDSLVGSLEIVTGAVDTLSRIVKVNPWLAPTGLTAGGILAVGGMLTMVVGQLINIGTNFAVLLEVGSRLFSLPIATMQLQAAETNLEASGLMLAAAQKQMLQGLKGKAVSGMKAVGTLGFIGASIYTGFELLKPVLADMLYEQQDVSKEQSEYFASWAGVTDTLKKILVLGLAGKSTMENQFLRTGEPVDYKTYFDRYSEAFGVAIRRELSKPIHVAATVDYHMYERTLPTPQPWSVSAPTQKYDYDAIRLYAKYQNDIVLENQKYANDREKAYQNLMKRLRGIDSDYAKSTIESNRKVHDSIIALDKDVSERRLQIERDLNDKRASIIETYNDKIRQLAEAHSDKVFSLVVDRDARGLIEEHIRYQRALRDEKIARNRQLRDAKKAYDDQMTELEKYNSDRRIEIETEYSKEVEALENAKSEKIALANEEYTEQLSALEQSHAERLSALDLAQANALADIMGWNETLREQLLAKYSVRNDDLRKHLADMLTVWRQYYYDLYSLWDTVKGPYTGPRPPGHGEIPGYDSTSIVRHEVSGVSTIRVEADDQGVQAVVQGLVDDLLVDRLTDVVSVVRGSNPRYGARL